MGLPFWQRDGVGFRNLKWSGMTPKTEACTVFLLDLQVIHTHLALIKRYLNKIIRTVDKASFGNVLRIMSHGTLRKSLR